MIHLAAHVHVLRFFFPANVLVHMEGEGVDDSLENQEQFVAIMDIYIKSFMQPDMDLFRQNLKALQELHQRHKLFSKVCTVCVGSDLVLQWTFCLCRSCSW